MGDNTYIKASIINFDKKGSYRQYKKCVVPISVGQPAHEGKKFEATIDLINQHFDECIILVCDTLQKYSMAILHSDETLENLYDISEREGEKWIKRNSKYIKKLNIPYEISKWDEWLGHNLFKDYVNNVSHLYTNDFQYARILNECVEDYIIRLSKREEIIDNARAVNFSQKYIKEECAAMSLCVIDKNYDCILYPTLIAPVGETIKDLIKKDSSKKFSMLGIRFKKRRSPDTSVHNSSSLEYIINNIPGHVYWKDTESRFLGCNMKQALSYGAKNIQEIINKTDSDLIGKKLGDVIRENDLSIIQTGKAEILEEDILMHNKQITVVSHKSPFVNQQGEIVGVFGVSIDISEQKEKEERLSYQNELSAITLDNIIAKMPGHIYWKDTQGVYLGCNDKQAHSLGISSGKEIIGKTDNDLPWGEHEGYKIIEHDQYIIKNGNTKIVEEPVTIKNNKHVFLSHKSPLKDSSGNILGMLGVSIDITHQKNLEEKLLNQTQKLESALSEKKRFLNNLSHEIRTPLHVIKAIADELYQNIDYLSKEEMKSFLETLVENNERLMILLTNLLEIAKSTQGKNSYKFEKKNIISIVECCVEELKSIALIEIKTDIKKMMIKCDEIKISQVIRNLLNNAIKYGNSSKIIVNVEKIEESEGVIIRVKDKGIGIPKNEENKIFEPFYQSSNNRKGDGGTGLGLSICKEIIESHKGKIWVDRDPLGMTSVNIKLL